MNDAFSVGVGIKRVASLFEIVAKLFEVINLSVKHDPDRFVFVMNRLMPTREVDDAKASHANLRGGSTEDALVIRATVHNQLTHRVGNRSIR